MPGTGELAAVNDAIREALQRVTLAEMTQGDPEAFLLPRSGSGPWCGREGGGAKVVEERVMATAQGRYATIPAAITSMASSPMSRRIGRRSASTSCRPLHLREEAEPAWLAEWRLGGYRRWLQMEEPSWQKPHYPPIDYQAISYYSAPKQKEGPSRWMRST